MTRRYLGLALIAFAAYSLVAPLLKVAMEAIPSTAAVFISNAVMLVLLLGVLVYTGESPLPYFSHAMAPYILLWGVALAVSLLAYYRALELGPVSVVVPVYGLFIAVSSVIGIAAFDESVTKRKAASIGFAILAIVLMSV